MKIRNLILTAILSVSGLMAGTCDGVPRAMAGIAATCTAAPAHFAVIAVTASSLDIEAMLIRVDFKDVYGRVVGSQTFEMVTFSPYLIVLADPTLTFERAVKMPDSAVDVTISVKEFRTVNGAEFCQ